MRIQFISAKVASRLCNALIDIQQSGVLDKKYFDPDGYGVTVIPQYIARLDTAIKNAQLLNMTTSSQEFMVPFDHSNNGYMITKVLDAYQLLKHDPEPTTVLRAQYDVDEAKALRTETACAQGWDIAREAMYNASKAR